MGELLRLNPERQCGRPRHPPSVTEGSLAAFCFV
jgi:hypothetical protein